MIRSSKSQRSWCRGLTTLATVGMLGVGMMVVSLTVLGNSRARAGEWFDLNEQALETFDFGGHSLPASVAELKDRYPTAELDSERATRSQGLESYVVKDLPNVDSARFFFCDGRLYQFEARYELPRVEKLGGMRFVLQKLIDTWGPVDHAGDARWTWYRPQYSRRADFYTWPDSAKLTITDTGLMPIVNRRIAQAEAKEPMNLGFESR